MAYDEDLRRLARLEKLRVTGLIVAIALIFVSMLVDAAWVYAVRAIAWGFVGVVAIFEGRTMSRLGRDPDVMYLWAAADFFIAGVHLYMYLTWEAAKAVG